MVNYPSMIKESMPVAPTVVIPTEIVPSNPLISAQKEDNVVNTGTNLGGLIGLTEAAFWAPIVQVISGTPVLTATGATASVWGLGLPIVGAAVGYGVAKGAEALLRAKKDVVIKELVP